MGVTIDPKLQSVYDKLNGKLDGLSGKASSLSETLSNVSTLNTNFTSSISDNYNGQGKDSALSSLKSINNIINTISGEISGTLSSCITSLQSLVSYVDNLIILKQLIEDDEAELSKISIPSYATDSEKASLNAKKSTISNRISANTTKFNTIQENAKSILTKVEGMDKELKTRTITLNGQMLDVSGIAPGTFGDAYFTDSNGTKIHYYIYLPEDVDTNTDLSVHVFLHGSGERYNCTTGGLGKEMKNGLTASGIVICPETGPSGYTKAFLQATKELTDSVVTTFETNPDKISLSGHSMGSFGCVSLACMYPDYFSKIVILSNCSGVSKGMQNAGISQEEAIKRLGSNDILFVTGKSDTGCLNAARSLYNTIKSYGNAYNLEIPGTHSLPHPVFNNKFTFEGKTYDNLLEYCLAQVKDE